MTYIHRQMEQLLSQMESMTREDLRQLPVYQVRLLLRDELVDAGFRSTLAAKLALNASIDVSADAFHSHRDLLDRMVKAVARLSWMSMNEMARDFPEVSEDALVAAMDKLSINLNI